MMMIIIISGEVDHSVRFNHKQKYCTEDLGSLQRRAQIFARKYGIFYESCNEPAAANSHCRFVAK